MTLEEAIKTAIEYETRVVQTYQDGSLQLNDPVAKKIFGTLAKEEEGHVQFLQHQLDAWKQSGHLDISRLESTVPQKEAILANIQNLKSHVHKTPNEAVAQKRIEMDLLHRALTVELETSAFYKKVAGELNDEGHDLFARFVEIEDGHVAIVQAEMDAVSGLGFWFDMKEFNLESE